jgi:hypothetical protein
VAISRASDSSIQDGLPKYNDIWDGTTATSAFDSLGTVLVTSTASSITFSNIPQTYTHLHIRMFAIYTGSVGSGYIAFNGDNSSTNYSYHGMGTDGVTPPPGVAAATSQSQGKYTGYAGTSPAGINNGIIDIFDYTSTAKYKSLKTTYTWDANGTGYIEFSQSNWRSTSAITSIVLTPANTFSTYTSVSLYGIK